MLIRGLLITYTVSAVLVIILTMNLIIILRKKIIFRIGEPLYNAISRRRRKESFKLATMVQLLIAILMPVFNTFEAIVLALFVSDDTIDKMVKNFIKDARKDSERWGIDFDNSIITGDTYLDSLDELDGIRRLK